MTALSVAYSRLFRVLHITGRKNCEIEINCKYKSMHNRWPKNENINTMKNSNNCTLDWMDSLDCYSCMTPTAKLATPPPRNVRENSLSRMRADHSFHHTPDTRHQRGEERMWRYDGSGLTANIASAAAGGAGVEACSACSVYTGQCPLTAGPQHLFQWLWIMRILAFILSTSNWILGKKLLSIPAI